MNIYSPLPVPEGQTTLEDVNMNNHWIFPSAEIVNMHLKAILVKKMGKCLERQFRPEKAATLF